MIIIWHQHPNFTTFLCQCCFCN